MIEFMFAASSDGRTFFPCPLKGHVVRDMQNGKNTPNTVCRSACNYDGIVMDMHNIIYLHFESAGQIHRTHLQCENWRTAR